MGGIVVACGVAPECLVSTSGIVEPCGVGVERLVSTSGIHGPCGVGEERLVSTSGIGGNITRSTANRQPVEEVALRNLLGFSSANIYDDQQIGVSNGGKGS